MKILIVEDDERIALPLKEDMERQHHIVELAADGNDGLQKALETSFDLLLLDIMLPGLDGLSVCRQLRERGCTAAIIMLTARRKTDEKIQGLDAGADDYLPKPFQLDELHARIRAVIRRGSETKSPVLRCGALSLDCNLCVTRYGDNLIDLTPTEYRLMENFLNNPNRIYGREELMDKLWRDDKDLSRSVIKTHIKGLRKKLVAAGAPDNLVETVYGYGYRLNKAD